MPINQSTIVEDHPQRDGRRWVRERHVDHLGVVHFVPYLAEQAADAAAIMAARVATLEAGLAEREHQANIDLAGETDGSASFQWTTAAQFVVRLRVAYQSSRGVLAVRIGRFFHRLNLGDAVLRNLFGITQEQVAALRARFLRQHDLIASILSEAGQ